MIVGAARANVVIRDEFKDVGRTSFGDPAVVRCMVMISMESFDGE